MLTEAQLQEWDAADPLAPMRAAFSLPPDVVYLDGNSLGPLPRTAPDRVARVVAEEWGGGLIRSWNDAGWIDLAGRVADKIARIVGAAPGSVAVADNTTINLFKLLGAALALRPGRRTILSQTGNFPTDLYVAEGLTRLLGQGHRLRTVSAADLPAALDADCAVLLLTHVDFRSGARLDMRQLTEAAHAAGALVLWDLAHSAGAMPIDLAGCRADLAVGCGYKFLNGGPGAPAFLYIRPDLAARSTLPLQGWLGHAAPFAFEPSFRPAPGIGRAIVGTPPIVSLAALECGVDTILSADLAQVRTKSERMGDCLIALVEQRCPGLFGLASPAAADERGSQVSFSHPDAYAIVQALIARGIVGDFRAPNLLRFGLTPLYVGFVDLWRAVTTLAEIMTTELWRDADFARRRTVT